LSRLPGFWTFQAKRIGFCLLWEFLDVSGQKNRVFLPFGGFWTFQAKRIRICFLWGDFGRFRLTGKALVEFWKFQAKRIRFYLLWVDLGRFRLKEMGFVSLGGSLDISGQKNPDLSPLGGFRTFQAKRNGFCILCGDF
jgi:hypothetical protein